MLNVGDFHFLWECLRVIFLTFWGTPSQLGSLSNMREYIRRLQVDKQVKIFSVGDEFLIHVFKAHLLAAIFSSLKISSISDSIPHDNSFTWLNSTAKSILDETIIPTTGESTMHRSFLHMAFLYIDLRNAIRFEDGPHIVRHYKMWLPRFIGTGRRNYAVECVHLIGNLYADFPKHISYIATHNRTVNTRGKRGHGKPIDQMVEHYNL